MSQFMDMIRLPNYQLGVAKGQFLDVTHIHKFGAAPGMSVNTSGTVWDINDTPYPWSAFDTAGVLSIPAVNASDDGKSLIIMGLDSDYLELSEEVTLSSSQAVTTIQSFKRVHQCYIANGSTNAVGDVLIQKGGTTVAKIIAGRAQTLMAIYTVPAGKTGYLLQGTATCQSGADATGDMFVRYFGESSFRDGHSFEVSGNGGQYQYTFAIPIKLPEKSDLDVRASVRSNKARITAAFCMVLDED